MFKLLCILFVSIAVSGQRYSKNRYRGGPVATTPGVRLNTTVAVGTSTDSTTIVPTTNASYNDSTIPMTELLNDTLTADDTNDSNRTLDLISQDPLLGDDEYLTLIEIFDEELFTNATFMDDNVTATRSDNDTDDEKRNRLADLPTLRADNTTFVNHDTFQVNYPGTYVTQLSFNFTYPFSRFEAQNGVKRFA